MLVPRNLRHAEAERNENQASLGVLLIELRKSGVERYGDPDCCPVIRHYRKPIKELLLVFNYLTHLWELPAATRFSQAYAEGTSASPVSFRWPAGFDWR